MTRVVDQAMNDAGPNVHGEIVHRSAQVMLGYWEKPEETRAAFEGGWFHSGDVGYLDEDGYLYIVDRIKDVINTGGVQVASREVEEALFTHPAVSEAAVIAIPHPLWVEAIAAVVVLREGMVVSEAALIDHARSSLAGYKLPKTVFFAQSLPKNTAGQAPETSAPPRIRRQCQRRHGPRRERWLRLAQLSWSDALHSRCSRRSS